VQQGLSLSGTGAYDSYSIDLRFYFNDVNVSPPVCCGPFSKPSGLYSHSGFLDLFASSYHPGDPSAVSSSQVLHDNTLAALRITRDPSGLFTAYVNGDLLFSVMDNTGSTKFSGPDNIIYFFIDDLETLSFSPEGGTGYIDSISVTVNPNTAPRRAPAICHRPRRVGFARLAQQTEGRMKDQCGARCPDLPRVL